MTRATSIANNQTSRSSFSQEVQVMRAFVFCVICLVSAVAQAQQPACPNGRCNPVDTYKESRGPLLGKRVTWQAGTSRGSFRRGPLGLWKTYSYSR